MKSARSFLVGAFYLVSGVYSVGFSMFIDGLMKPISGGRAYVLAPDALFPYEVMLFSVFGVAFFIAAFFHFRNLMGMVSQTSVSQTVVALDHSTS